MRGWGKAKDDVPLHDLVDRYLVRRVSWQELGSHTLGAEHSLSETITIPLQLIPCGTEDYPVTNEHARVVNLLHTEIIRNFNREAKLKIDIKRIRGENYVLHVIDKDMRAKRKFAIIVYAAMMGNRGWPGDLRKAMARTVVEFIK